jgi:hypothetical protein
MVRVIARDDQDDRCRVQLRIPLGSRGLAIVAFGQ